MDIMQDAYISAFRNLKQIEDPKRLKSWFNCIVANKCKDWLKKKKPQLFSDIPTGMMTGNLKIQLQMRI